MVENLVGIDDQPAAIEIENVSVSIAGVPVLDNISFTIRITGKIWFIKITFFIK